MTRPPLPVQGQQGPNAPWADLLNDAIWDVSDRTDGKVGKGELVVNVKDFGAKGDGATDDTAALRAAFAKPGATRFLVPEGVYKVSIPETEHLASFSNAQGVVIDGAAAKIDNSGVAYASDPLTAIFQVDNCKDFRLTLGEYIGYELPTPTSQLGYLGATLVRAINGCDGVTVNARVTNARYGVQSGEYGDPSMGGCKNFDITLRGSMVGYPLAVYLGSGIRHDIDVDGVHRATYIAGCDDVRGVVRWRDQYIADTAYLITDALTSGTDAAAQADPVNAATTSRGCSNIDVSSIDKGSSVFQPSSRCAGITLSRVDPCAFRNIKVQVSTTGTDATSTTVGGWCIVSGAKAVQSRYPYNWEQSIVLDNITVSGVVDHSAATLPGNTGSEFYCFTYDASTVHSATVRGFHAKEFTFKPSSGNLRPSYFQAPGLASPATFEDFTTPGVPLSLFTNTAIATTFERATLGEIQDLGTTGGNRIVLGAGTVVAKAAGTTSVRTALQGGTYGGAGAALRQKETTLNLSGASTPWAVAIPTGCLVLAVQGRVQSAIMGATGYTVGPTGDAARYVNTNTLTAGSTFGIAQQSTTEVSPRYHTSTSDIVVTAKSSNFTGGSLRLILTYIDFSAPTD